MWVKKSEYKRLNEEIINQTKTNSRLMDLINRTQKQYDDAMRQVDEMRQKYLTRRQILSEWSYQALVSMAECQYGIRPQKYDDKADLIEEILCVEKRLK